MLPIHRIVWNELRASAAPVRVPEPSEAMVEADQIRAYVKAYEWGGPTSALQLHHLRELAELIRPGDTVLDLACGPGPLLLELAPIFPDCHFIGADLSPPMLEVLRQQATERGLGNIETRYEDIRSLPSIGDREVDLVISTSALHHLPNAEDLRATLQQVDRVLKVDGGFYIFDFGLLRSRATRALMVADVARRAPRVTAQDYAHSLDAAFPITQVVRLARDSIVSRTFRAQASSWVDFFYFLQTAPRTAGSVASLRHIDAVWANFSWQDKIEHLMLRAMRRKV